jgi:hypothetical protein
MLPVQNQQLPPALSRKAARFPRIAASLSDAVAITVGRVDDVGLENTDELRERNRPGNRTGSRSSLPPT